MTSVGEIDQEIIESAQVARVGRPTLYKQRYCQRVRDLLLLGLKVEDICEVIGIGTETYYRWKNEYSEFRDAIEDGKTAADARAAKSLYKRAIGLKIRENRQRINEKGEQVTEIIEKELPPDVGAATMWLKNRQPGLWHNNNGDPGSRDRGPTIQNLTINVVAALDTLKTSTLGSRFPVQVPDTIEVLDARPTGSEPVGREQGRSAPRTTDRIILPDE